jgi:four helix bundle protein
LKDFKKLQVWEKSHRLTLEIYKATQTFPRDELYGLTGQIRRSCASIPANIAEGCGRNTNAEFVRFLDIAMGSASELQYHLILARDLGYLNSELYPHLEEKVLEVKRMLAALITKIRRELSA